MYTNIMIELLYVYDICYKIEKHWGFKLMSSLKIAYGFLRSGKNCEDYDNFVLSACSKKINVYHYTALI